MLRRKKPGPTLGTGWELILQYRIDGQRALPPGAAPHTRAQLETIRHLNLDFGSETLERPETSKKLWVFAKIIYFRNLDITDEDITCLTSEVALGSYKERSFQKSLTNAKCQYQGKS